MLTDALSIGRRRYGIRIARDGYADRRFNAAKHWRRSAFESEHKMAQTFKAQVEAWARMSERRLERIFKESAQRTVEIAQDYLSGRMVKVQTGFLRASMVAQIGAMPPINLNARPAEGREYQPSTGEVVLLIARWEAGQPLYVGYTAAYARHVHDGTSKMAGRPWVTLAAMQWQTTVNQVTQEAKARIK